MTPDRKLIAPELINKQTGKPVEMSINYTTDPAIIIDNVRQSIKRPLPQCQPLEPRPTGVILLAGGPSLNDHRQEILDRRGAGELVVTCNGAYNWLLGTGAKPSATVLVDARPFMTRFVSPAVDGCKYLLASQCAPEVYDALDGRDVWQFHCASFEDEERKLLAAHFLGQYIVTPGGSTVGTRAIALLYMLGWRQIEVFGLDSCIIAGKQHAYAQKENDDSPIADIGFAGRTFQCAPWMYSQGIDFINFLRNGPDDLELAVHGNGLIATIIETAAAWKAAA